MMVQHRPFYGKLLRLEARILEARMNIHELVSNLKHVLKQDPRQGTSRTLKRTTPRRLLCKTCGSNMDRMLGPSFASFLIDIQIWAEFPLFLSCLDVVNKATRGLRLCRVTTGRLPLKAVGRRRCFALCAGSTSTEVSGVQTFRIKATFRPALGRWNGACPFKAKNTPPT
jgi:hypothetical protein